MDVPTLTSPSEICHNKIDSLFGWQISGMDISLQFHVFIYENWLIVAIIYHSNQDGN